MVVSVCFPNDTKLLLSILRYIWNSQTQETVEHRCGNLNARNSSVISNLPSTNLVKALPWNSAASPWSNFNLIKIQIIQMEAPHSSWVATNLSISSMLFPAFFGSFATACQYSPCLGSLRIHFAMTSAFFSF